MTHLPCWFICTMALFMGKARSVETYNISKYVCSGDSIPLFQNIKIDSLNMVVSLFINGATSVQIAMWTMQDSTTADGYNRKVFHDAYGDVWIRNVHPSDEALYTLRYQKGNSSSTYEVYLRVLVAPTWKCKPKIKRVGDILSASLSFIDCGKPAATAYWLDYPGMHYESKDLMKLPPKNKAGTYYACIEGQAISCVRNSMPSEYCSSFTTNEINSDLDSSNSRIESSFVMLIVIMVGLPVGLVVLIIIICWRRKNLKHTQRGEKIAVHQGEKVKLTQEFAVSQEATDKGKIV